jgi:fatty-acyl-CoA synthase
MSGYLREQDGDPVLTEDGWLRTGDLGTLDARGYLRLLGRADDVIKCRGIKIFPAAVEEALGSHPDVLQCHVFGTRGEDEIEQVQAAVALRPGATVPCAGLGDHVADRLTELHVPDVITVWTALPMTTNGKPDRRRLAAWSESDAERIVRMERISATCSAGEAGE